MGSEGAVRTDEDELCVLHPPHLRNLLEGRTGDPDALRRFVLASAEAAKFNDPGRPHLHPSDPEIARPANWNSRARRGPR